MPAGSEKDGAPSLALSRLQLLGVGLTYNAQKHHSHMTGYGTGQRENSGITGLGTTGYTRQTKAGYIWGHGTDLHNIC